MAAGLTGGSYIGGMIQPTALPADVERRLATLGPALARCPGVVFAYLFGSAATGRLTPLSDVEVAIYVAERADLAETRLAVVGVATAHLASDAVDVVVLNTAPAALTSRILASRRVVLDQDPLRRHRYESQALREGFDFRLMERRLLARRYGDG
jgi:predicted nucleotidyltransferase